MKKLLLPKLFQFVLSLSLLVSCSETEFSSSSVQSPLSKNRASSSPDSNTNANGGSSNVEGFGDGANGQGHTNTTDTDLKINDGVSIEELQQVCWFAVSGFYVGGRENNNWDSKFPGTTSGNPISTGETFDLAGGVYLNARKEPYVQNDGSNTIDKAIEMTFDGFVVAPGMRIEIKDGTGAVLYSGDGPLIVRSNEYGNNAQAASLSSFMRANKSSYPQWLQDHLETIDFTPEATPLHNSQSVQVDVIPGESCEGSFK